MHIETYWYSLFFKIALAWFLRIVVAWFMMEGLSWRGTVVGIGALGTLRELRVSHNKLTALPREIGNLVHLQKLVADHNLLTSLPGALPSICSFYL